MVDAVYRSDSRRVLATLIRLLGDFDLAEEALHDAFTAAVERWPRDGVPANPRAWLVSAGRHERSEEHTSELQSRLHLVCRLLLEKKKKMLTQRDPLRHSPKFHMVSAR